MKFTFFAFLSCVVFFSKNYAQETKTTIISKRIYTTKKLKEIPVIDGVISEKAWDVVEWSSDFTERSPDEGTPPTYQTRFKVMYDAKYLYVAIRAFDDEPHLIQKRLSRRDGFEGDRVNVIIDSYHDKRTAFVFTTTAAGVKGEEIVTENGDNWDESWNPVWYTNAKVDELGWTAEMKIPLSQLRFGKAKEQIWGFNVNRTIFRLQERSLWQRIPLTQAGMISEAGELHGLVDLIPQKQLEIQPFTVLQYDNYPKEEGNPFRTGSDFSINGGLDAKIGITNDLTLDLTINPDFGQVEADPGAIALDGFQIFFREQRPFFVENFNIFDFEFANGQDNIFYSRRIGRNPHESADLEEGEFADTPINSTILGAAKFSGKTKSGWSIGVLESVTGNEFATIRQVDGSNRKQIVEPLTNYFVTRVQKDFNKRNSFIGGIFTATNRNLDNNFETLHKAAYTGGIDFRHTWKNRDYYVEANTILSRVEGSATAIAETQKNIARYFQREDATHVKFNDSRTSLTGTGGRFEIGKQGGNWRYNGGYVWRSPELELNDVGFLRQTDEMIQFTQLAYLWQVPTKIYRNIELTFDQGSWYDFGRNLNGSSLEYNVEFSWINNWWTETGAGYLSNVHENSFLRGGPRWRLPNNGYSYFFFGSDRSKKLSFTLGYVKVLSEDSILNRDRYVVRLNYQPVNAFSMFIENEFTQLVDRNQYVNTAEFNEQKRYVLGEISNDTWTTTLRLNYSINPDLSIQFYGQPFISRGRFSNYNYVVDATARNFNERVVFYDENQINLTGDDFSIDENQTGTSDYTFENPDFSVVQLRTNLVARWEYIPGSELFFVWARGGNASANPQNSLGRGLRNQAFTGELQDTFLIKATYRFLR
jgi:hypothetical protein